MVCHHQHADVCTPSHPLLPSRKPLRFEQYTSTRLLAQFDDDLQPVNKISMRISTGNVIGPRYKIRLLRIRFTPLERPERSVGPAHPVDRQCGYLAAGLKKVQATKLRLYLPLILLSSLVYTTNCVSHLSLQCVVHTLNTHTHHRSYVRKNCGHNCCCSCFSDSV